MNLAHWGFHHWPFERTYSADRFYSGLAHEEAMARMLFLIEKQRRCGIVTGPSGTGKTFLLRLVQQQARRLGHQVICCDATGLDGRELLGQIATGCQIAADPDASTGRIWGGLQNRFIGLTLIQQPLVVIIDHFDQVDSSCHLVLRRLHQMADAIGTRFTNLLASREQVLIESIQDFVELRSEIPAWTLEESTQFIWTATRRAGCRRAIFTEEALRSIYKATTGIPSGIVSLCHLSLLGAMARNETLVTDEMIAAAASELYLKPEQQFSQQTSTSLTHHRSSESLVSL